jgi:hypothetical protein
MKTRPGLRPIFSLVIFVLIGLTSGLQCAHAGTVSMLTGDFFVDNGGLPVNQYQNFVAYAQFDSISQTLTVNPSIGSYVDNITCGGDPVSSYNECDTGGSESGRVALIDTWSGTFSGGSVSLTGPLGSFTGTITRGSFSGTYYTDSLDSTTDNSEEFSFAGTWANGWRSEGRFEGFGTMASSGLAGNLNLNTNTAPEPGSMALLAAGIAALAALRCRTRQMH